MADLVIPKTSFKTFNRVLRAYYLTHLNTGMSIKEIAQKTGYNENQINKSNKFLKEIKFLEKVENKFKLSEIGYEYAEKIRNNKEEEANEILFKMIREYKGIKLITNYVEVCEPVTREQLAGRIEEISLSDLTINDHKAGINCLIEILLKSGILTQKNDQMKIADMI